jgi:hypothetical protein
MRTAAFIALLATLASGCPESDRPSTEVAPHAAEHPASPKPEPSDGSTAKPGAAGEGSSALFHPLDRATAGARTHVLALSHDGLAAQATIAAWSLGPGGPSPAGRVSIDALPIPSWPGHTRSLVAYGSGDTWVAAEPDGARVMLVRRGMDGRVLAKVALDQVPAAIHAVGDRALVGLGAKVGLVDFAAETPALAILHERADMYGKPYDLFVQRGEWLVAIDDEVAPIYADAFTIGATEIRHDAAWDMPTFVNGSYFAAQLAVDREHTGTLYALAHYGIMSGTGQDLVALPIEKGALKVGGDVVLNARVLATPPVLEEHRSDDPGDPSKVVAGTEMTTWRNLALVPSADAPERVLLAAAARGLLSVPADFGPTTKAETIDVGGDCLDVRVHGDVVHVLVGRAGDAELVILDAKTRAERSRHALGGPFDRFR